MGISGKEATPRLPKESPSSAQNQMILEGCDHHDTSGRCNEEKAEGAGDHRQESGNICERHQESATGSLNLGEPVEVVQAIDAARIAPQPPTENSLHRQIVELQLHLQKAEVEKVELIKQGDHQ